MPLKPLMKDAPLCPVCVLSLAPCLSLSSQHSVATSQTIATHDKMSFRAICERKKGRKQPKDVCPKLQRNLEEEDREVTVNGRAVSAAPA